MQLRSIPKFDVAPLRPSGDEQVAREAVVCKYLHHFTWLPNKRTWEEFEGVFLDMGTSVVGGAVKRFSAKISNRGLSMAHVTLGTQRGGPLRPSWNQATLSPGQSAEVILEFVPVECGEWCGELVVSASWCGKASDGSAETMRVPTYMRVVHQGPSANDVSRRLPWHAPRPFRPGSACRIRLDPTCLHSQQLRMRRPASSSTLFSSKSRPSSMPTTAGTSLPSSSVLLTGRPGSGRLVGAAAAAAAWPGSARPGSGQSSGRPTQSGRPGSGRTSTGCRSSAGGGLSCRPSSGGVRGVQLAHDLTHPGGETEEEALVHEATGSGYDAASCSAVTHGFLTEPSAAAQSRPATSSEFERTTFAMDATSLPDVPRGRSDASTDGATFAKPGGKDHLRESSSIADGKLRGCE